ncbi:type I phosphomannose isomerase catalytic subunit [Butyrivibrio sp. MC2013]|uniref:type I phosphomannose isomerase catalytic subunit n=1 Tax=Butyrivibrio sp. MC2013 TaxID=1280686 RepID=UPI0004130E94|nr:type I phosphomannose isomerase catalytic subunit [Butyrivibrio sp. MC2013]
MKKELIRLRAEVKHTIWGGDRLSKEFACGENGSDIGELWSVSAHPGGDCKVMGGSYDGFTLSRLWEEVPQLFGSGDNGDRFPLLVKIIDARDKLSIQVHPDDEYARVHENGSLGKTECWYILDCEEGAELVLGHNAGDKEELSDMIDKGEWDKLLRKVKVKKGDFLQIDPGTVHAIGSGILILETQQSSDITYRVYDYDRLSGGVKRPLHIAESKAVITAPAAPLDNCYIAAEAQEHEINKQLTLYSGKYYSVYKINVDGEAVLEDEESYLNVTVVDGEGEIDGEKVRKGDSLIIPCGYGRALLKGKMMIIASKAN